MRLILLAIAIYLLALSPYIVVVSSESMEPTLHVGDIVILSHRTPTTGDVIVYDHNGILIIHRIIGYDNEGNIITKGDNPVTNKYPDPRTVKPEDVKGVAVLRIPYLGYVTLFIRENPFVIIPILIVIALYDRILPEIRRDRRKTYALIAFFVILILLRFHPWTPEKAYLISRNAYQTGSDEYYVFVKFYASGDVHVIIKVVTDDGSILYEWKSIRPGTSGERSVGLYINSVPIEVSVWKVRSRNGERSTRVSQSS